MSTQVLRIGSWFRVSKPNEKNTQATSTAPPPKEVLAKQAAPQMPGKALAPRLTSAEVAHQKLRVEQQSNARVAAAAAAAAEAPQKEKEKQMEQKAREQERARVKQLQEAKRLKAQAMQLKFMTHNTDAEKEEPEQHNPHEISREEDPSDDVQVESKPKALKGESRFVVAGPAKGRVKAISTKETWTEANRRGDGYQNNLVATQQTLEDMYLHTARVRYHYQNCSEMGGLMVKKIRESGRTETRDLNETLGFALCCVQKCSLPVTIAYLGVSARCAPGAGTTRNKLMQEYGLHAAAADALARISTLRPYPHASAAVATDTLGYPR